MSNNMKMGHLQNIQLFETCVETRNLQSYDEQSICKMGGNTTDSDLT